MYIARKLRRQNLVAYVLYMYQVEDVIRTYGHDIERLAQEYLIRFDYDDEQLDAVLEWYDGLIRMMREEGCQQRGHVQVVRNTIYLLADRHKELLADPKQPYYSAAYYKALPFIVELRGKSNGKLRNELETCLDSMYGYTLLKMQKKPVSAQTSAAIAAISHLLNMLAGQYDKEPE